MTEEDLRLYLHNALLIAFPDVVGIHYRPPGNMILQRPCIVYEEKESVPSFANSNAYVIGNRYQVTILSNLPGYPDTRNIYSMAGVVFESNQSYTSEDIVHNVFTITVNALTR